MRVRRRFHRFIVIGLAVSGLAAPAAQARLVDPPLGGDSDTQSTQVVGRDLRSPDARDAARFATASTRQQALARERAFSSYGPPAALPRESAPAPVVQSTGSGLDWTSIGFGAAGFLAAAAAFAAANALMMRRRHMHAVH